MNDSAGCIIVTTGLPDPDYLFRPSLHIPATRADARVSVKENVRAASAFSVAFGLRLRVVAKENRAMFVADEILASDSLWCFVRRASVDGSSRHGFLVEKKSFAKAQSERR